MGKFKVIVSDKRHDDYSIEKKILKECDAELTVLNCKDPEDMINNCKDADGILLDMASMNGKVIKELKNCKVISRYGVGYENVDIESCTGKGIYVTNVPDYCADDVSDMALSLLFACQRQIALRDREVRNGKWNMNFPHTYRIKNKILSIIGFGKISRALIKKVSGFELKSILVNDPYVSEMEINSSGAKKVSFEEALKQGDYISLHLPVNNETKGIVNERAFSLMKPSAILINTSRGQIVNEKALLGALKKKIIAYAGLDTHSKEPIPMNSEFFKLDNCVLTDHTGYNTKESIIELKTKAALNVKAVLEGNKPLYPVNKIENSQTW